MPGEGFSNSSGSIRGEIPGAAIVVGGLASSIEPAAAADCERILGSWWGQPVNTLTAAGFVVAGVVIWWRRRDLATALLIGAIGAGSIVFHGPMLPWGEYLHDASIALTLVWILLVETRRERLWPLGFTVGLAVSATPSIADPAQAVLAVGALGVILLAGRRRPLRVTAVGILAGGALVGTLSRTGGPLCDPDSLWQGHGFWHLAAAAALAIWGLALRPEARSLRLEA
jgi:hypothetical protein